MSVGHTHAKLYTPAQLSDECEIATERNNELLAKVAVGIQGAVASVIDKQANQSFCKYIKDLTAG